MNTLEAFLQDRNLKYNQFSEGFPRNLNENKYMFNLQSEGFNMDMSQKSYSEKATSLRKHIKAFNTRKTLRLTFDQPNIHLKPIPAFRFHTEVEPFNIIQHRSHFIFEKESYRWYIGLTNQNLIQQAQDVYEVGVESRRQDQNSIGSQFSFNTYTGNTFWQLKCSLQNQSQSKFDGTLVFKVGKRFKLHQAVLSGRFNLYGQQLMAGFLADPYWDYYLRGHKSLDDSQVQLSDSWFLLSWRVKQHLLFTIVNDFHDREFLVAATGQWKPFKHMTLTHNFTSQFEIQNQVIYQLSDQLKLSFGSKAVLKGSLKGKHFGSGIELNI